MEKLINHIENCNNIGVICPIVSDKSDLGIPIFEGFNYAQMNVLLERKFKGIDFDTKAPSTQCLMISRKCLIATGVFNDYAKIGICLKKLLIKVLQKNFKIRVAIDTYVYVSDKLDFKEKRDNINIICEKKCLIRRKVEAKFKNNSISFIRNHLTKADMLIKDEVIFYLPSISQNSGGAHVVVEIVNYLTINGINANIIYDFPGKFDEIMLFNPINRNKNVKFETEKIVATLWRTTFIAKKMAIERKIPLIYFVQGYEVTFDNGRIYGCVELSYKLADYVLCISEYLRKKLEMNFNKESHVITNGINYEYFYNNRKLNYPKTIAIVLRDSIMKGDWILLEIIKQISIKFNNVVINVIYQNSAIEFPENNNNTVVINRYHGPLSKIEISHILKESDIFIDASLNEGFGLFGIEAMSAGCVLIASNSLGNSAYLRDGYNGIVIFDINNANHYIEKLSQLLNNHELYNKLQGKSLETAKCFDMDNQIPKYIKFFRSVKEITTINNIYTKKERNMYLRLIADSPKWRKIIIGILPKFVKDKLKQLIKKFIFNK